MGAIFSFYFLFLFFSKHPSCSSNRIGLEFDIAGCGDEANSKVLSGLVGLRR